MSKEYVCVDEYQGCTVGTLDEIGEWQLNNDVPHSRCSYYEIGKEVNVSLKENE